MPFDDRTHVGMVRDHRRDFDVELAGVIAVQQVHQAMAELGHHDDHARLLAQIGQGPDHLEALGDDGEQLVELALGRGKGAGREDDAAKEPAAQRVAVLGGLGDEAVVLGQEAGNGGDDANGVRAGDGEHVGLLVGHELPPRNHRLDSRAKGFRQAGKRSLAFFPIIAHGPHFAGRGAITRPVAHLPPPGPSA
jgi:hypothetical protein